MFILGIHPYIYEENPQIQFLIHTLYPVVVQWIATRTPTLCRSKLDSPQIGVASW